LKDKSACVMSTLFGLTLRNDGHLATYKKRRYWEDK